MCVCEKDTRKRQYNWSREKFTNRPLNRTSIETTGDMIEIIIIIIINFTCLLRWFARDGILTTD